MRFAVLFAVPVVGLFAMPALADAPVATITDVSGKVTVQAEGGSFTAETGSLVYAGSKVIVALEATANLMIDGCAISLSAGSAYVVPREAPCLAGEALLVNDGVIISQAADLDSMVDTGGVAPPPPPPPVYAAGAAGLGTPAIIGLATFGAAAAAAVAGNVLSDEEVPVTPN